MKSLDFVEINKINAKPKNNHNKHTCKFEEILCEIPRQSIGHLWTPSIVHGLSALAQLVSARLVWSRLGSARQYSISVSARPSSVRLGLGLDLWLRLSSFRLALIALALGQPALRGLARAQTRSLVWPGSARLAPGLGLGSSWLEQNAKRRGELIKENVIHFFDSFYGGSALSFRSLIPREFHFLYFNWISCLLGQSTIFLAIFSRCNKQHSFLNGGRGRGGVYNMQQRNANEFANKRTSLKPHRLETKHKLYFGIPHPHRIRFGSDRAGSSRYGFQGGPGGTQK